MPDFPAEIDAVVAGHLCLDISPGFPADLAGATLSDLLRPGSLTQVAGATVSTGGSVANTGINLLTLGLRVALMGKVGDDFFAHGLLALLAARGLDKSMVRVPGEQTSYTIVLNPPGVDRIFLHCPGANDTFAADDVRYDVVRQARLFHLGYPPIMRRLYQDGGRELAEIFRRVKSLGPVATSLDMALPDPASEAGRADWPRILGATLPHVDFFLPSAEEILFMLERERFLAWRDKAAQEKRPMIDFATGDDLTRLGDQLLGLGAKVALIKCGHRGLYGRTTSAQALRTIPLFSEPSRAAAWAQRELWQATFFVEPVVSATGAGDSAIAGFLGAVLRAMTFTESLEMGCAVGACNVTALDALSGVLSWEETRARIARGWKPNPIEVSGVGWQVVEPHRRWSGPRDRKP